MSTLIPEEILKKLWKSRNIMLEVLLDRGYPVEDSDFMEYDEFIKKTEDKDEDEVLRSMILEYERTSSDKIIVVWPSDSSSKTIKDLQAEMVSSNTRRAIIVARDNISSISRGYITGLAARNILINVYPLDEAQYNIMKHELVPKHRVCSSSEKKKILEGYSVEEEEIPYIKLSDPTIRHIGAIQGQLIEITRESETQPGMNHISYRIVARYPPNNKNNQMKAPVPSQWLGPGGRCWNP